VSVLVNGSQTQEFKPQKGLKQGDPFLIAVEGLTGVVRKAIEKNMIGSMGTGDKLVKVNMLQ